MGCRICDIRMQRVGRELSGSDLQWDVAYATSGCEWEGWKRGRMRKKYLILVIKKSWLAGSRRRR